jgi:predicted nucleic acid-binding protein
MIGKRRKRRNCRPRKKGGNNFIVAAITLEHDLVVLTADEYFRIIPGVVVDA